MCSIEGANADWLASEQVAYVTVVWFSWPLTWSLSINSYQEACGPDRLVLKGTGHTRNWPTNPQDANKGNIGPASKKATPSRGACRNGTGKEEPRERSLGKDQHLSGPTRSFIFIRTPLWCCRHSWLGKRYTLPRKRRESWFARKYVPLVFIFKKRNQQNVERPTSPSETFQANVRRAVDRSRPGKSHKNQMVTMRRCTVIYKYA